eukprot:Pgem_evm1s8168
MGYMKTSSSTSSLQTVGTLLSPLTNTNSQSSLSRNNTLPVNSNSTPSINLQCESSDDDVIVSVADKISAKRKLQLDSFLQGKSEGGGNGNGSRRQRARRGTMPSPVTQSKDTEIEKDEKSKRGGRSRKSSVSSSIKRHLSLRDFQRRPSNN